MVIDVLNHLFNKFSSLQLVVVTGYVVIYELDFILELVSINNYICVLLKVDYIIF